MNFGTWDQRELHLTGAAAAMCVCVLIYLPGIVEEGIHYFDDLADFMAIVVAVQLIIFGILAIACNNAVLGFMVGIALPEAFRMLPKMEEPEE
jgi:hypothetical protein